MPRGWSVIWMLEHRSDLLAGRPEREWVGIDVHGTAVHGARGREVAQDVGDTRFDVGVAEAAGRDGDHATRRVDGEGGVDGAGERRFDDQLLLVAVLDLVELLAHVAAHGVLVEA